MKKEIKDYLHLYLGCEVEGHQDQLTRSTIIGIKGDLVYLSPHEYQTPNCDKVFTRPEMYVSSQFVKPILRPLLDMTEGEANNLLFAHGFSYDWVNCIEIERHCIWYEFTYQSSRRVRRDCLRFDSLPAGDFRYLLSKDFDLFDLIPAGLAINKTTIKALI